MWTVEAAATEQVSVPTIAESLFMRYLSEMKEERTLGKGLPLVSLDYIERTCIRF